MTDKKALNALISIKNWGQSSELEKLLKYNSNTISLFHVMGKSSYIIDAAFISKSDLEDWIRLIKGVSLPGGVPAILDLQTRKIIEVNKGKQKFSLTDYMKTPDMLHFFMFIDTSGESNDLIESIQKMDSVFAALHIQGEHSYVIEIIAENYNDFKNILTEIKKLESVNRVETQEVISVLKYRGEISDDKGNLLFPEEDTREMYTL
ncbi:MAG: Lrp/AsnC ligand binding domain-containing protein [Spirochaetes bacterium]|nr:Lrp/AsnC ligand binding domain-containing protein [Spirochaetota bacterium]